MDDAKTRFLNNIESGLYSFEKISCAICNGSIFEKLADKDRHGLDMSVVICKECGLVQTNPRMTEKSYDDFYKNIFSDLQRSTMSLDYYFQRQIIRAKEIENYYSIVTKDKLKNKRILDVGCSAGGIVAYFSEIGNDAYGFDLDEKYIEFGKKHGANIEIGKIEDVPPDEKFDLIIYRHVFEHMLHPLQELEKIKKHCSDDTLVYVEVPGIKNIENYRQNFEKYLTISHCYHFTLTTLKNMMQIAGFEYVSGNEIIHMLIRKGSLDKKIKNDYDQTSSFLRTLAFEPPFGVKIFKTLVKLSQKTKLDPIARIIYRKFGTKYKKN